MVDKQGAGRPRRAAPVVGNTCHNQRAQETFKLSLLNLVPYAIYLEPFSYMASLPVSPVRMRMTSSTGRIKILPSPI